MSKISKVPLGMYVCVSVGACVNMYETTEFVVLFCHVNASALSVPFPLLICCNLFTRVQVYNYSRLEFVILQLASIACM